jgi:ADP-ribosyl-[dinitrogen reductase] hydrolase
MKQDLTVLTDTKSPLLGLACGDAVGAAVEFYPRGRFVPLTDMVGGGKFRLQAGEWTDDTAMALCLAESLIVCRGFDALDQMQRYWRWANEGYWSCRPQAFGMGKTVSKALRRFHQTGDPYAGSDDPSASGNGSLMRLAPIPMAWHFDRAQAIHWAIESSRLTHASAECLASCAYFSALIWSALQGVRDKTQLLTEVNDIALPSSMQRIRDCAFLHATEDDYDGSGHVVATLEAALWAFFSTDSFEQAILRAANLGGDADTTAAVCGQLAGAFYGLDGIPEHWLEKLARRGEIEAMARGLAALQTEPGFVRVQ